MAIGIVYGGGIDSGIPSNIGTIKAHVEEFDVALTKGTRHIQLNPAFKPTNVLGALTSYGGYLGGQPMMNWDGNYQADYGLAFHLGMNSDGTLEVEIYLSGSYTSRKLIVIVFYQ